MLYLNINGHESLHDLAIDKKGDSEGFIAKELVVTWLLAQQDAGCQARHIEGHDELVFSLGIMSTLKELEVEYSGCLKDSLFHQLVRTGGVLVSVVIDS